MEQAEGRQQLDKSSSLQVSSDKNALSASWTSTRRQGQNRHKIVAAVKPVILISSYSKFRHESEEVPVALATSGFFTSNWGSRVPREIIFFQI
ncbi:hypothetical protein F0562_000332 [Nyssa sinensis]|uniref:Uncharacterized protein n=1 Tax=Nyssa sinensis TaxID=561372 RepID=A0A5J5C055_9ASTE|nr:hypothetical protein F0562_000332 [Nyssa sinensis]